MLYLAEVQKQKSGFGLGGGKAELKLLARQQGEQNWIPEPRDSVVPSEEANSFNAGALVLVELSANKQVQRIQEAAARLVSILQNFSQAQEKFKDKEDEIKQWQESLTYQSQELNRREMEIQAREEELEQMSDEFERLDQRRQEIESADEEFNRLRDEVEKSRLEVETAWERLRAEMQNVEERQAQIQGAAVLDQEQSHHIQELLNRLSGAVAPTDTVREQLHLSLERIETQQAFLNQHWQQLEPKRAEAQRLQDEVDRLATDVQNRWSEWQQAQDGLEQSRSDFREQQRLLSVKQEQIQVLKSHIGHLDEIYQQLKKLAQGADLGQSGVQVDIQALENMNVEELQTLVHNLQQDLEKVFRFVNDQEEELTMQRQTIDELKERIQAASEYDRLSLETELAEEQESYEMLNETLVGQRRNLREREEVLSQHQVVLWRRLGTAEAKSTDNDKVDLTPALKQLETKLQQQNEQLQTLEREVTQIQSGIKSAEETVNRRHLEQENKRNELKLLEQNWYHQKAMVAEFWGRVNLYQEMLQPLQDQINELKQKLEASTSGLNQIQETGDHQLQAIAQLRQILLGLMASQEQLAS